MCVRDIGYAPAITVPSACFFFCLSAVFLFRRPGIESAVLTCMGCGVYLAAAKHPSLPYSQSYGNARIMANRR